MNINRKNYIEAFIKIRTKTEGVIDFKLNKPQLRLYKLITKLRNEGKPVRIIILKSRQMGFSTFTSAYFTTDTVTNLNRRTVVMAHKEDATRDIFDMYRLMVDSLPEQLIPERSASNAQEIVFDTKDKKGVGSKIRCMTAGASGAGRGSTIDNLHLSEVGMWEKDPKETYVSIIQAVPRAPNTHVIIESTAKGMNFFKELWDQAVSGESSYIPFFAAWYEMDEYREKVPNNFKLTAEEEEMKEKYNLDDEQVMWYRSTLRDYCAGDRNKMKEEYPNCPEEAFIASGNCVFDKDIIIDRINQINGVPAVKQGYFKYDKRLIDAYTVQIDNIEWVDDNRGPIKIFREPFTLDKEGRKVSDCIPYAIGGDTAGDGSDFFAAHVIDNISGNQVAVYHKQRVDEDLFADQMYCLGKYYNDALIGLETNFSSAPMKKLVEMYYPTLYIRESVDTMTKEVQKKYGFLTTSKTRPLIISELVQIVRENVDKINDIETLREMLTFIKNENGRAEADVGKHDDLVMSLAITHYVSGQQITFKTENKGTEKDFISSFFNVKDSDEGEYIKWDG